MTGVVIFCALALAIYGWAKPAAVKVPVFAETKGHDAYLAAVTNGLEA